ncbi:TPA: hypothetical protein HA361_02085 [Candidatus Woesearchaeota archaeon]|nr:hypothetical protein [Candidatus Woesearchaeota archaeon]HII68903.1 hypothetical protein [Candidatus Woesearchaeota archaeon]
MRLITAITAALLMYGCAAPSYHASRYAGGAAAAPIIRAARPVPALLPSQLNPEGWTPQSSIAGYLPRQYRVSPQDGDVVIYQQTYVSGNGNTPDILVTATLLEEDGHYFLLAASARFDTNGNEITDREIIFQDCNGNGITPREMRLQDTGFTFSKIMDLIAKEPLSRVDIRGPVQHRLEEMLRSPEFLNYLKFTPN